MKRRFLCWIHAGSLNIFGLTKYLQNEIDGDFFAIYDFTEKPKKFFRKQKLVDFKLEFGRERKEESGSTVAKILIADEISPDTCRLWDATTDKKLDKDLFRKDLGNLIEGYQEVARRLGILHEQSNISPIKFTKPTAVKIKKK